MHRRDCEDRGGWGSLNKAPSFVLKQHRTHLAFAGHGGQDEESLHSRRCRSYCSSFVTKAAVGPREGPPAASRGVDGGEQGPGGRRAEGAAGHEEELPSLPAQSGRSSSWLLARPRPLCGAGPSRCLSQRPSPATDVTPGRLPATEAGVSVNTEAACVTGWREHSSIVSCFILKNRNKQCHSAKHLLLKIQRGHNTEKPWLRAKKTEGRGGGLVIPPPQ